MASRLDDLIREHAERLDQLAGPIDLTDVTSAAWHDTTTVALVDNEPTWNQTEGRHRWPVIAAAAIVAVVAAAAIVAVTRTDDQTGEVPADQPTTVAPTASVATPRGTGGFEGIGQGSPSVTYTVPPDGWLNTGFGVVKRNEETGVYLVNAADQFYTSSCGTTSTPFDQPVGPTVDDLVSAWANQPGVNATAARDVTIDGFDGQQIEFTVPDYKREDCAGLHYRCSFSSGGGTQPSRCTANLAPVDHTSNPISHLYYQAFPNHHQKVWVFDFDGTRLLIVAWSFPNTPQQDRAAIDQIVASIQIG
jgi:hypothetical protein